MYDWRAVQCRERQQAKDPGRSRAVPKYNLFQYWQGKYFQAHPGAEPECLQRARSLAYAWQNLPLSCEPEQRFFGGRELYGRESLPQDLTQEEYDSAIAVLQQHGLRNFAVGWDHTIPDYRTLLSQGLPDFLARAEQHAEGPTGEAMLIALRGLQAFLLRAAAFCRQTHPEAAAWLGNIAVAPPDSFAAALQLLWIVHVVLLAEGRYHNALGRVDQYLLPAYQRDSLSRAEALDLLCHVWVKIEGFHQVTNICIGGVTPDGEDAVNELSYLALEATGLVHCPHTNLSARLHPGSPEEFLLACTRLIRTGIGFPAVFNDAVNVPMLQRLGIPEQAARDYALVGCVECVVPGRQVPWSDGRFNMPRIFTDTVLNLARYESYSQLWQAFAAAMASGLQQYRDEYNQKLARFPADRYPDPLLSALVRSCLERQRDVEDGGADFMRLHGIGMMGLGTLADSLAAVQKLVYQDRAITPEKLVQALKNDFQGDEPLRQMLLHRAPKYGNDEELPDAIAADIVSLCGTLCQSLRTIDGGYLQSCMASNVANIPAGAATMATPDGRHAGQPLSDAASPSAGRDRKGPTALVKSITRPDYAVQNCTVVNLRFAPDYFCGEQGERRFLAILKAFVAGGGHEMQFNVTDNEVLEKAMSAPEDYAGLIVRVSGFSDFFVSLNEKVQRDILARNVHH